MPPNDGQVTRKLEPLAKVPVLSVRGCSYLAALSQPGVLTGAAWWGAHRCRATPGGNATEWTGRRPSSARSAGGQRPCPLRARSEGDQQSIAVIHEHTAEPLTCKKAGHAARPTIFASRGSRFQGRAVLLAGYRAQIANANASYPFCAWTSHP
jgi:hypothetical protein